MSPELPPDCTPAVNRTYLSNLEKGASYPGLEIIDKLATVLEVDPTELLRVPALTAKERKLSMG
jgi:transcriptional regulator with XRE-family HTH domain